MFFCFEMLSRGLRDQAKTKESNDETRFKYRTLTANKKQAKDNHILLFFPHDFGFSGAKQLKFDVHHEWETPWFSMVLWGQRSRSIQKLCGWRLDSCLFPISNHSYIFMMMCLKCFGRIFVGVIIEFDPSSGKNCMRNYQKHLEQGGFDCRKSPFWKVISQIVQRTIKNRSLLSCLRSQSASVCAQSLHGYLVLHIVDTVIQLHLHCYTSAYVCEDFFK